MEFNKMLYISCSVMMLILTSLELRFLQQY